MNNEESRDKSENLVAIINMMPDRCHVINTN